MTDDELALIEHLSDGGQNLRAIDGYLSNKWIEAAEVFHLGEPGHSVAYHLLLRRRYQRDGHITKEALSDVWQELAGSGASYTGLFGPLNEHGEPKALLDAAVAIVPFLGNGAPVSAPQRAALCVRWLSTQLFNLCPDLATVIQRHLSEILVAHPVLMHPAFLCPMNAAAGDVTMSLAHALAASRNGELPRLRHFGEDSDTSAADSPVRRQLLAFATNPCVQLGLGQSTILRWSGPPDKRREVAPLPGFRKGGAVMSGMVRFLSSVMELDDIKAASHDVSASHGDVASASAPIPLDPGAGKRTAEYDQWMGSALTFTFYGAAGMSELGGQYVDPQTLAALERRGDGLAQLGVSLSMMDQRIFGSNGNRGSADIEARTQRLCRALARTRFPIPKAGSNELQCLAGEPEEVLAGYGQFVLDSLVGGSRRAGLPWTGVEGALAFFRGIDAVGGFGSMKSGTGAHGHSGDSPASITIKRIRAQVHLESGLSQSEQLLAPVLVAHRAWETALEALWAEKQMRHTIDTTLAVASDRAAPVVSPPARPTARMRL